MCRGRGSADADPTPDANTQRLRNAPHNYCLLYPADHHTEQPNPDETVLFVGLLPEQIMNLNR